MTYTQVDAQKDGKGLIHGTIYFGIKDEDEAICRFLSEYPEYSGWNVWAKVYIGCYDE